ncbi:hypothetical protein HDU93_000712 [Gonapodya sp. JEL0774]|nr:hypothetical protein HDU93_000712 [Gonapodya sp. JEL0774]
MINAISIAIILTVLLLVAPFALFQLRSTNSSPPTDRPHPCDPKNLSQVPMAPSPPPVAKSANSMRTTPTLVSELTSVLAAKSHLNLRCSNLESVGTNTAKTRLSATTAVISHEAVWSYGVMGKGDLVEALANLRKVKADQGLAGPEVLLQPDLKLPGCTTDLELVNLVAPSDVHKSEVKEVEMVQEAEGDFWEGITILGECVMMAGMLLG